MKRSLMRTILATLACAASLMAAEVPWYTVDCGAAAVSTSATYTLQATAGQHDAGPMMVGATMTLVGGYWAATPAGAAEPEPCPADLDGDGAVGLSDLGQLLAFYGSLAATPEQGDLDGDMDVDLSDLGIFLAAYGQVCP